jgi:hypothetical protein
MATLTASDIDNLLAAATRGHDRARAEIDHVITDCQAGLRIALAGATDAEQAAADESTPSSVRAQYAAMAKLAHEQAQERRDEIAAIRAALREARR